MAQDDPVRLADHALDRSFNADVARREIEAALAAERRRPRQELSRPRARPQGAGRSGAGRAGRGRQFGRRGRRPRRRQFRARPHHRRAGGSGRASPEPRSAICSCSATFAMRCAKARGWRRASRPTNLILGLACVGIAITAGTYATLGAGGAGARRRLGAEGGAQDRPHDRADGANGSAARCARSSTGRRCAAPSRDASIAAARGRRCARRARR